MKHTATTLLCGYGMLLQRASRAIATLAALVVASALTTAPVWFLATRTPRIFNALVLALLLAGGALVYRQRYRSRLARESEKAGKAPLPLRGMTLLAVVLLLTGLVRSSPAPALAGALLLSGRIAWGLGSPRRHPGRF
ncbi:hypothetical protein [Alkalispirochaeta alkalica]|uniref:hypothetical protein n=1 Tax=Alkalispirochaeta alkalica TaxID=46356 RepID=UPI0012FD761D|nr:hypothetical protein [Alkalispirochaeta alkalica]